MEEEEVFKHNISDNNSAFINLQSIELGKCCYANIKDSTFFWNNINSSDDSLINHMYSLMDNTYQKKINLVNMLIKSNFVLPSKSSSDIIKFFNTISILSPEYSLGEREWVYKFVNNNNLNKLFIHNSVSKKDKSSYFYNNLINPIKNIFVNSSIKYYYYEYKSKRFNKTTDIIFVFDL
jgi:hypothetical protein